MKNVCTQAPSYLCSVAFTLAINTATPEESVSVFQGDRELSAIRWMEQRNETEVLLPHIEKLLKKQKLRWSDLSRIAICCGPGSFSALRIGVTVANTLAAVLKIPLYELAPEYWENGVKMARAKRIQIGIPKYSLPPNITKPNKC